MTVTVAGCRAGNGDDATAHLEPPDRDSPRPALPAPERPADYWVAAVVFARAVALVPLSST
jgi:hypothetical protein